MGPHGEAHRRYYQDCVARWSDERYAWTSASCSSPCCWIRGRHARAALAAHERDVARPRGGAGQGPGASRGGARATGVREEHAAGHYELDCAQAALAGQAGADLSQAPLTFFVSLYDYKPASADVPCRSPGLARGAMGRTLPDLPGLDVLLRRGA